MRFFLGTVILATALAAGAPASAVPIPSAVYSGSLCPSFSPGCTPLDFASTEVMMINTSTSNISKLTFGTNPSPYISATVYDGVSVGTGGAVANTSAGLWYGYNNTFWNTPYGVAGMTYYASATGPAGVPLPIDLAYTISWSGTPGTYQVGGGIFLNASAHLDPAAGLHPTYLVNEDQIGSRVFNNGIQTPNTRTGILTDTIISNTVFDIGLEVYARTAFRVPGSFATVTVDPVLYIDPSFAAIDPNYLTDFTIELSPGVRNAPNEIPEPMTLPLFLAGLAGIFGLMRLQRPVRLQSTCTQAHLWSARANTCGANPIQA